MEQATDGGPTLSPQEQELLAYLEDLQANNPTEYNMIVEQMQKQQQAQPGAAGAGGGGAAAAGQEGEHVVPTPGFVAKTRSSTKKGQKVFINLCQSDHIDKPSPVEGASTNADEVQMRIPLSLGPPREDLDKEGDVCTVYDVVFHPETIEGALGDADFRDFVMQLTLHQIEQKHKDELSQEIKFPKLRGNYKGIAPLPQYMRKKGTKPPPPPPLPGQEPREGEAGEAAGAGAAAKAPALVEELEGPTAEELPSPMYSVDTRGGGEGDGEAGGTEHLTFKAHLPDVAADEIELSYNSDALKVHVPGRYNLELSLPRPVETPPTRVRFETARRILSATFRVEAAHDAVDASAAEVAAAAAAAPDEEQARRLREREARQNAKSRRSAGNRKRLAPVQVTSSMDDPTGADGDGSGDDDADASAEASEAAPGLTAEEEARRAEEEEEARRVAAAEAAAAAAAAAEAEEAAKWLPLVLQSTIIWELEE